MKLTNFEHLKLFFVSAIVLIGTASFVGGGRRSPAAREPVVAARPEPERQLTSAQLPCFGQDCRSEQLESPPDLVSSGGRSDVVGETVETYAPPVHPFYSVFASKEHEQHNVAEDPTQQNQRSVRRGLGSIDPKSVMHKPTSSHLGGHTAPVSDPLDDEVTARVSNAFDHIDNNHYGMFPSEARMIVKAGVHYSIDLLIESGTANGVSTEALSRSMPNVEIHTIDTDVYRVHKKTKARLEQCCPPVTTHIGNSLKLLPKLLAENQYRRIGVVIDGPKGRAGLRLAAKVLASPNVYFVAIHDTAPFWKTGDNKIGGAVKESTWTPDYREKYGYMDQKIIDVSKSKNKKSMEKTGCGLDIFYKQE